MLKMKKIIAVGMCVVSCLALSNEVYSEKIYAKEDSAVTQNEIEVGVPDQKVWTFTADKEGSYKLIFSYERAWQETVPAEATVSYQLKVVKDNSAKKTVDILDQDVVNTVKQGQKFRVMLVENPSTGYSWSFQSESDTIKLVKESNIPVFNKNTENIIKKGQEFTVELTENGSTGYSWNYKTVKKAMKLVQDDILNLNTKEGMVGVPYERVWTFKAVKAGKYTIKFSYTRPWEKSEPAIETAEIQVIVK
jgi:Predicted secreted protein